MDVDCVRQCSQFISLSVSVWLLRSPTVEACDSLSRRETTMSAMQHLSGHSATHLLLLLRRLKMDEVGLTCRKALC